MRSGAYAGYSGVSAGDEEMLRLSEAAARTRKLDVVRQKEKAVNLDWLLFL
ncbi:hypothetical protein GMB86_15390, partial [Terrilactibacillus sp. BCM23-1]|nr:hypothetical protein [Terrilactibacillus tamarindi]